MLKNGYKRFPPPTLRGGKNYSVLALFLGVAALIVGVFFGNIQARSPDVAPLVRSAHVADAVTDEGNASPYAKRLAPDQTLGVLRGNAVLIRGGKTFPLSRQQGPLTITFNDRIVLKEGDTCLFKYPDGRMVKFSGAGEYRPQLNDIRIVRGGMVLSFSSSPKGYKIRLPVATLGIRGTTIHVQIAPNHEEVWIDEGIVDWVNRFTEKSGILIPGEGLKFSEASQEPISTSPLGVADRPVFDQEDIDLEPPLASYPLSITYDDETVPPSDPGEDATGTPAKVYSPFEDAPVKVSPNGQ